MSALEGVKCSFSDCAREAQVRYAGRAVRGRLPEGGPCGIPYCRAHYHQIIVGGEPRTLKVQGPGPYRRAIEDAARVADFHGAPGIAKTIRELGKKR